MKRIILPENEIANRLITTSDTLESIAKEYNCSKSTIKTLYSKYTTKGQREILRRKKQSEKLKGKLNPAFAEWRKHNDVWSGRKHSNETKVKQSKAKLGKSQSLAIRIAQSARMQNIGIGDWKEFSSSSQERLKSSAQWKNWRTRVFERDNYTCQNCGIKGGELHPHHIFAKSEYPKLIFNVSNGITMCTECHKKTDSYGVNRRIKSVGMGD